MGDSTGVVRVGVKRWDRDQPAGPEKANAMIGPMWVEIDGVRIPGDILCQASASFESDGDEAASPGFGVTTFKVITSSYQTVDHETGEPVEA